MTSSTGSFEQFERLGLRSMEVVRRIVAPSGERVETALRVRHPRGQRRQVDDGLLAAFAGRYVEQFGREVRVRRLDELRGHGLAPEGG